MSKDTAYIFLYLLQYILFNHVKPLAFIIKLSHNLYYVKIGLTKTINEYQRLGRHNQVLYGLGIAIRFLHNQPQGQDA